MSENDAKYAIHFAKSIHSNIILLHIENINDDLNQVNANIQELIVYADKLKVKFILPAHQLNLEK